MARMPPKRALVVVQAFPPLLKNAGGVAKRYLSLCRALIDQLGWTVTMLTPVDVTVSGEKDVDRWLAEGSLVHLPARGVRLNSVDGVVVVLDLFSFVNTGYLLSSLCLDQRKLHEEGRVALSMTNYGIVFLDDPAPPPRARRGHPDRHDVAHGRLEAQELPLVPGAQASVADAPALGAPLVGPRLRLAHLRPTDGRRLLGARQRDLADYPVGQGVPRRARRRRSRRRGAAAAVARAARAAGDGVAAHRRPPSLFAGRWSSEKRIDLLLDVVPDGAAAG